MNDYESKPALETRRVSLLAWTGALLGFWTSLALLLLFIPGPLTVNFLFGSIFVSGPVGMLVSLAAKWQIRCRSPHLPGYRHAALGFWASILPLILILMGLNAEYFLRRPGRDLHASTCINNLRQLDGAKEEWALNNHKNQADTPTMDDLICSNDFLKLVPACPMNGTYNLNSMVAKPTCTIAGHTLP
jgi:hypothetical protein